MKRKILLELDAALLAGVDAFAVKMGVRRVQAVRILIAGGLEEEGIKWQADRDPAPVVEF